MCGLKRKHEGLKVGFELPVCTGLQRHKFVVQLYMGKRFRLKSKDEFLKERSFAMKLGRC